MRYLLVLLASLALAQEPVPGVKLTFSTGEVAYTDSEGKFTITFSGPYTGTVVPSLDGYVFSPASREFTNLTGEVVVSFVAEAAPLPPPPPPPSPPADTISPNISITSPRNGASVTWPYFMVRADANDNVGVTRVEWRLDGILLATVLQAPWGATLNTSPVKGRGWKTLTATAFDAAGNSASSSVRVRR